MKKVLKNMLLISIIIWLSLTLNNNKVLAEAFNTEAESVILIDYETGKVMYEKNSNEILPPASMSKMLTEYIVLEAIKNGDIHWDTTTTISDYGHWISINNDFSGIALNKNVEYSVKDLFNGVAVYSDNAAVITLLELISKSETEFIDLMAEKAKELGLTSSTFVNATGINNESLDGRHPKGTDPNGTNKMTARDLAILGYRLITDYPEIIPIASQPEIEFHGINLPNWNWMLKYDSPYLSQFYFEGVDGIKTGSSREAGYSFTSTVEREGKRYLAVVMKGKNEGDHFRETKKLYEYAYNNIITEKIDLNNYKKDLAVENGQKDTLEIKFEKTIDLPIIKGDTSDYELEYELKEEALTAPIKENEHLGTAILKVKNNEKNAYLLPEFTEKHRVDIYSAEAINKKSVFSRLKQALFSIFS